MDIKHLDFSQVKANFNTPCKRKKVICIILVAAFLSVFLYYAQSIEYKTWQPINGVLTKVEQNYVTSEESDSENQYTLHYSYIVDAVEYIGQESFDGTLPDTEYEGKTVEVWYNSDNHSQSSYNEPKPGYIICSLPLLIAAPICLYILGVRKKLIYFGL